MAKIAILYLATVAKVEIKAISAQPTELELDWAGLSLATETLSAVSDSVPQTSVFAGMNPQT